MHVLKILHCNYCMYTCEFRINAKLLKESSFRINAKLVKEELKVIYHPLYGMNKFVTINQSCHKMAHKCFLIWVIGYHVII